eukprot:5450527-Amphidinium_carterae.1
MTARGRPKYKMPSRQLATGLQGGATRTKWTEHHIFLCTLYLFSIWQESQVSLEHPASVKVPRHCSFTVAGRVPYTIPQAWCTVFPKD